MSATSSTIAARPILDEQNIRHVLQSAMLAPSPDNNQPWTFRVQGDRLRIGSDEKRALPSDHEGLFQMLALGAAAENARLAARQIGYDAELQFDAGDEGQPAHVELTFHNASGTDPLAAELAQRCTCRRWYSTRPLPPATLDALTAEVEQFDGVRLHWVTQRATVRQLAWLIAACDRVRFEHREFHDELYKQLRFTAEEAERTRDGLDLRTLELPPGAGAMLAWLRPWTRMRRLQRIGLSRLLALPSVAAVRHSAAIGVLAGDASDPATLVAGGRAMQRAWLAASAQRVAVQPLGSMPIFLGHLGTGADMPQPMRLRLQRIKQRFEACVPEAAGSRLLMLFRVGHHRAPSFRSLRRPVAEATLDSEN